MQTARIAYVALGSGGKIREHAVTPAEVTEIEHGFSRLLDHYLNENSGFTSRYAMEEMKFEGDYDHLARFGEWDETQEAKTERVGR